MPLDLMYITNKPGVALIAEKYGVNRIWVDLETLGKEERQKNINSVKSHHTVKDIAVLRGCLRRAVLQVRVNPWNKNSPREIEEVLAAGAQVVMLPMWKSCREAENFLQAVKGRARTNLLLETREAGECLAQVLENAAPDEFHIGLNDLHLSYGLTFMFELLANGTVERLGQKITAAGLPFGFGGIAKLGQGLLPAEKIILEHYRLGSTRAILSRSFCNYEQMADLAEIEQVFNQNMQKLRQFEEEAKSLGTPELEQNRREVARQVGQIVKAIHDKTN